MCAYFKKSVTLFVPMCVYVPKQGRGNQKKMTYVYHSRHNALAGVRFNGMELETVVPHLRDRDVVHAAAMQNPLALRFAPDELQNDKRLLLAVLARHGAVVRFDDAPLWTAPMDETGTVVAETHAEAVALVRRCGSVLGRLHSGFAHDPEVVLEAVRNDPFALRFASVALRNDVLIVATAVHANGVALRYASSALRASRGFVLLAVASAGWAVRYASPSLRRDPEVALAAVTNDGLALLCIAPTESHTILEAAVRQDRRALLAIPPRLHPLYVRAGPVATRHLFRRMGAPFVLPDELVVAHILPHCHAL